MDVRWVAYVGSAAIAVVSLAPATLFRSSSSPASARPTPPRAAAAVQPFIDIEHHADRLAHYRQDAPSPRTPGRNPFRFEASRPAAPPAAPVVTPGPVDLPAVAPRSSLRLVGMAERNDAGTLVRVAVISDGRELYLVKPGERVGNRFTVARIEAESVVLDESETHTSTRLDLE